MKRTALLGLLLALGVTVYAHGRCGRYPIEITSLDNNTCLPELFSGFADGDDIRRPVRNNCTPTVNAFTGCRCQDEINGVSGYPYCVYSANRTRDDNTANITLGLCGIGAECYTSDFHASMEVDLRDAQLAHRLKVFPRSPCVVPEVQVTNDIRVAAGCEYFCYGRHNKDINDRRVCIELLTECTHKCPNGSRAERADGLACLFRKTTITNRNVAGVCKKGTCKEIRELDACTMVSYGRNTLPVPVAKTCACRNEPVANETLCALSHSWGFITAVGICLGGLCERWPPDRPGKHTFKKKECKVMDVQVTPELVVAAACSATCRRYETEARPDGTLCLLQYRRDTQNVVGKTRTLYIGECSKGECRHPGYSFQMTV